MANQGGTATGSYQPAATQTTVIYTVINGRVVTISLPARPSISNPQPIGGGAMANAVAVAAGNAASQQSVVAAQNLFTWQQLLLVPITIQPASFSGVNNSFAGGQKINRPFIIRGVLVQCDNPKASIYARGGYGNAIPSSFTDMSNQVNVFSGFGKAATSVQSDGFPCIIAGSLLTPVYYPVDEDNSILWAMGESTAANTATNLSVTFFCDFSPELQAK